MKIKKKHVFVIVLLLLITTYVLYGYYIGFNCKFRLSNNISTVLNPDFFPSYPDLTVLVNDEILTQMNLPSDRLYEEVVINKRLKLGYYWIEARSDSMGIFGAKDYFILYPRNIYIAQQGSSTDKHMMISVD